MTKPLPKTLPAFNRRLAADGIPVEVVQGRGYVYMIFEDGNPDHYTSKSIMTPRFSDVTPDRWLADVIEFAADHAAVLAERAAEPPSGIMRFPVHPRTA